MGLTLIKEAAVAVPEAPPITAPVSASRTTELSETPAGTEEMLFGAFCAKPGSTVVAPATAELTACPKLADANRHTSEQRTTNRSGTFM
jgi:hypothetical protein